MARGRLSLLRAAPPPEVQRKIERGVRRAPGRNPHLEQGLTGGIVTSRETLLRTGQVPAPRKVFGVGTGGTGLYGGGDVQFLEPQLRNPLLSPSNFQLPQTSLELNQWIRYFDRFHPTVGNAMDMHSTVPFSRFELTGVGDPYILRFYQDMADSMDLFQHILEISREEELLGEVFPFLIWDYEMNAWGDAIVLNPDYIEIHGVMIGGQKGLRYELVIDHELRQFIMSNDPLDQEIIAELDPAIVAAAQSGMNAPLDTFNLTHLARRASPYDVRGSSILLGCIKDLLYDEQLREAMYAVAGGIVRPREIWKLGDAQNKWMPSEQDLDDFRALLASSRYDPNFALVSHYGVSVENVDAQRRILPLKAEWDEIDRRLLTRLYTNKAATTGEGPCCDPLTEVLTENGWKFMRDVEDGERLATYNKDTGQAEYQHFVNRIVKDYAGELVHFRTNKLDINVTTNHRMLAKLRRDDYKEWKVLPAEDVPARSRIPVAAEWTGETPSSQIMILDDTPLSLRDYLQIGGLYAAEGHIHRGRTGNPLAAVISQSEPGWDTVRSLLGSRGLSVREYIREATSGGVAIKQNYDVAVFHVGRRELAESLSTDFGVGSASKKIAPWIKALPTEYLSVLLNSLTFGDGSVRPARKQHTTLNYTTYVSISRQLADDVQEIAWKCGFAPKLRQRKDGKWVVYWSESTRHGRTPNLESKSHDPITREPYTGKVYCFEVPNEFLVTRRNGCIAIIGNTYANASVAMRILDARYAAKRDRVIQHLKERVFLPVALANDFLDRDGNPILPDFRWLSRVNLTDKTQQISYFMTLYQGGTLPFRAICDALDLDYQDMVEWLKRERGTIVDPAVQTGYKAQVQARLQLELQKAQTSLPTGPGSGPVGPDSTEEAAEDIGETVEEAFDEAEAEAEQSFTDARSTEKGTKPTDSPIKPPKEGRRLRTLDENSAVLRNGRQLNGALRRDLQDFTERIGERSKGARIRVR